MKFERLLMSGWFLVTNHLKKLTSWNFRNFLSILTCTAPYSSPQVNLTLYHENTVQDVKNMIAVSICLYAACSVMLHVFNIL